MQGKQIETVILDVDGVLTDGMITYTSAGEEIKSFSVKDGMAINFLKKSGIRFIVVTGKISIINEKRFAELGVKELNQGIKDKVSCLSRLGIDYSKALYVGDDINDYFAMQLCAYKSCPGDAVQKIKEIADYVATAKGGKGAFREIAEHYFKINIFDIDTTKQ